MTRLPLEGIKILDFSWLVTGPLITKCLADYGATVVRLETSNRPEILRLSPPYKDGVTGIDNSGYFVFLNAQNIMVKLSHNYRIIIGCSS